MAEKEETSDEQKRADERNRRVATGNLEVISHKVNSAEGKELDKIVEAIVAISGLNPVPEQD